MKVAASPRVYEAMPESSMLVTSHLRLLISGCFKTPVTYSETVYII